MPDFGRAFVEWESRNKRKSNYHIRLIFSEREPLPEPIEKNVTRHRRRKPHAHIMLTMRPFDERGEWGAKQKKEYIPDRDGNEIYDPKKRQYKCKSIPATDWNEQIKAEEWRAAWAQLCNQALEQNGHAERVDHRSYEVQGKKAEKIRKSVYSILRQEQRERQPGRAQDMER